MNRLFLPLYLCCPWVFELPENYFLQRFREIFCSAGHLLILNKNLLTCAAAASQPHLFLSQQPSQSWSVNDYCSCCYYIYFSRLNPIFPDQAVQAMFCMKTISSLWYHACLHNDLQQIQLLSTPVGNLHCRLLPWRCWTHLVLQTQTWWRRAPEVLQLLTDSLAPNLSDVASSTHPPGPSQQTAAPRR